MVCYHGLESKPNLICHAKLCYYAATRTHNKANHLLEFQVSVTNCMTAGNNRYSLSMDFIYYRFWRPPRCNQNLIPVTYRRLFKTQRGRAFYLQVSENHQDALVLMIFAKTPCCSDTLLVIFQRFWHMEWGSRNYPRYRGWTCPCFATWLLAILRGQASQ